MDEDEKVVVLAEACSRFIKDFLGGQQMKCSLFMTILLVSITLSGCERGVRIDKVEEGLRLETKAQHDKRMAWWRDAKFGMFIHWGVYAVPAGRWKGREIDEIGEWIMANADISVEEYEKIPPFFNPVRYDPAEWVRIARDAGMRYMVITSKHHDGFGMYDSVISDYDVVDSTPYGRDVLAPLSEECRKAGIKFCTYHSILDWHHPAQMPNYPPRGVEPEGWDKYGMNLMKPGRKGEYKQYMKTQLTEIVTQYDPAVMWFDGGWTNWWTVEDGKDILNMLWGLNPDMIINNRATEAEDGTWLGDYGTPEQEIPDGGLDYDWETCMTMNDTWGFKSSDDNWKPTKVLVFNLIDIVSKGGNFLLNVGPSAEGIIPKASIERLREIGAWLKVNGEAIYGTRPWFKHKEGLTEISFINSYEGDYSGFVEPEYTAADIAFTSKDNTVYAIFLSWAEEKALIKSFDTRTIGDMRVVSVSMFGTDKDLKWDQGQDGLVVYFPDEKPCKFAYVLKIQLSGQ
ncbi:MAG TPA: alpha-L-fucosidase [Planctomycetes bacterium]|nr:alpha-L-fucosidase [Planctomycetota bacterium]